MTDFAPVGGATPHLQQTARATSSTTPASAPRFPARVQAYLDAVVAGCRAGRHPLVSVAVFGSAARGGFSQQVSDVDLIVVLADGATDEARAEVHRLVARLEEAHGFRPRDGRRKSALEKFIDRAAGNALSCFVCTAGDLLSGSVARVLGLRPHEALLVDRIVFASIIASAVTAWGEDLLPRVPVPPIRRLDVYKALLGLHGQLVLINASYALLPGATRHAMAALKHSLHNCFFVYEMRAETLEHEVAFFRARLGGGDVLDELLSLRGHYRDDRGFVLRCIPTVLRLHRMTARENRFPRAVTRPSTEP
ncbi:nucleotidyltransferase domain-containing protein [Longimicrobium sp.]|uniref:nucleotidyltransferase domain-containing protein n=1 Tax=Longimicrobium sp. TaxID=2029185 RepID=UPI003B3BDE64